MFEVNGGNSKNIQVIDGARNCTYSIFAASDEDFGALFPAPDQDVEFIDDVEERLGKDGADAVCSRIWASPVPKRQVQGIHGTLFVGLEFKKGYYPTKRESEMILALPKWLQAAVEGATLPVGS